MTNHQLSVATWNLNCIGNEVRSAKKIEFLEQSSWDIACLQEVNKNASAALAAHDEWSIVDGLQMVLPEVSGWRTPHGAVLVARNGWKLGGGILVTNTPTPGRGVLARASRRGVRISVISWHAPNASGEGVETKMAGYRAVLASIERVKGPLVVGLDSNHWSRTTALDPPPPPLPDDPFEVEDRFFSDEPQHQLRDALVEYLRQNRRRHDEIVRERPDGPLEITYIRGHGKTPDRFDYLMISDTFGVDSITHDWRATTEGRSDHALVSATLTLD
jgi:endonuclease/exonuclease/phosphatase family metal-dependent hydrolase